MNLVFQTRHELCGETDTDLHVTIKKSLHSYEFDLSDAFV